MHYFLGPTILYQGMAVDPA